MNKVNLYRLLLIISITFFSCRVKQVEFKHLTWKNSGNNTGIAYSISKTGKEGPGNLDLQYVGRLDNDKFTEDSLPALLKAIDNVFQKALLGVDDLKQLPKGSKGYGKIVIDDFFRDLNASVKHFILFYKGDPAAEDLQKDSLQLAAMDLFKKIDIISKDEAAVIFSENSPDMEWKNFLDNNPLPASVELTLKKELLLRSKFDSVEKILTERFPEVDLLPFFKEELLPVIPGKQTIFYSFTVL